MPKNPFQYLRPVSPEDFIGRWRLVREIADDLTLEGGESHAIVGGRRCGKSSLLVALAHQLRQPETVEGGDWIPLPLVFDFKSSALTSAGGCLVEILEAVRRQVDVSVRRRPRDAWPKAVPLDAAWFQELRQARELSLRDFQDAIGYILDQISDPMQPARLVLLLDEMDELLGQTWTDALFNQLRALIYSSDVKDQVRLVLTGSRRFLDEVSDRGSPLWNVLMFHYLTAIDEPGIRELIDRARLVWPAGLEAEVATAIWQQSGGQPFLAQYLLYYLCQELSAPPGAAAQVHALAERFLHERTADLEGWGRAVEAAGLLAYQALSTTADWMEEQAIARAIRKPQVNVKRGLAALCYHSVVTHDGAWSRYRRGGDLFKAWFDLNGAAQLARLEAEAAASQIPGQIHAQTVIFSSSAQVEIGDDVGGDKFDVQIRDSQGIALGEDASAHVAPDSEDSQA
ncbi:MAG: AAA-like domain-containing protein [Anaerolineales bacterium]|nr:AAA-like domain-containing protein [Anaerolineales bacterium]